MSAEQLPKEFEKCTEVLPFTKYGLSSFEEFKKTEKEIQHLEWLKNIGLTNEEIKLYQDNEEGLLDQRNKVESTVLKEQLESIHKKICKSQNEGKPGSSTQLEPEPSTSEANIFERLQKKPATFYPEGHPMNEIKELEESLFGHMQDNIMPITKRRKMLRRLERRKERIMAQEKELIPPVSTSANVSKKGSLWDVKERLDPQRKVAESTPVLGPKEKTMYTIKDNKIVRLEPIKQQRQEKRQDLDEVINNVELQPNNIQEVLPPHERFVNNADQEYRAVDIVLPVNAAEEELLEGTKMCVDDIRKIERFKDYEPGIPSKVLYLKNIAPSVSQEQLSILFNQFQLDNGGPIDVRLMTARMRGQAFVSFNSEDLAIRALDEVNGTILSGRPVIAQFGRNSNRIQDDDDNR